MNVKTNIPLSTLTTMRIGGNANYVAEITSTEDLQQLYHNNANLNQPIYVVGGGSNLIAHDEGFSGIIIRNQIMGVDILDDNPETTTVAAGAGENWDGLVAQMVARNLTGIEAMSGIPGTVGAAPVQNIGAYGQELADTFVSLEAYDTQTDGFVTLRRDECGFAYRHSIFRGSAAGRYVITKVTLTLNKKRPEPPFYEALQKHLESQQIGILAVTPQIIRNSVLAIRSNKLPDPNRLPNAGSFFKNPIVENGQVATIAQTYPAIKTFAVDATHKKIPAGWLIENSGLKGKVLHGMKVHDGNAVVLINESAASYTDLAAARQEIIDIVHNTFQITLEQEPLELVALR
jgi:UDP-N-acetylmuramate dehydrogenase